MPTVSFFGNYSNVINNLNGSGLGFYGSTFGNSVNVGEYQTTTWITDSNGTIQGPQCQNVKFTHLASGSLNGAASIPLTGIPNQNASLRISITNATSIQIQNATIKLYDRASTSNRPSGVTTAVAEIIHPSTLQTVKGSGNSTWTMFSGVAGTVQSLALCNGPGFSGNYGGLYGGSLSPASTQHDYFLALSSSPDSIGSKTQYALLFSYEYL